MDKQYLGHGGTSMGCLKVIFYLFIASDPSLGAYRRQPSPCIILILER